MYSSIVLLMLFVCIVLYYVRGKYFNYGFSHAINFESFIEDI